MLIQKNQMGSLRKVLWHERNKKVNLLLTYNMYSYNIMELEFTEERACLTWSWVERVHRIWYYLTRWFYNCLDVTYYTDTLEMRFRFSFHLFFLMKYFLILIYPTQVTSDAWRYLVNIETLVTLTLLQACYKVCLNSFDHVASSIFFWSSNMGDLSTLNEISLNPWRSRGGWLT